MDVCSKQSSCNDAGLEKDNDFVYFQDALARPGFYKAEIWGKKRKGAFTGYTLLHIAIQVRNTL